jgi:Ala-tRNA(Pro) deacylase
MNQDDALLNAIDALGIAWQMHEHDAVFTVDESADLHRSIQGTHTKNMFLKDSGGQFWLITVPHDIRVDLKALPAIIGSKKLSFGKAEDMERLLGVTPGAVTPLAAINDEEGAVRVVIDLSLSSADIVNVHPLRNTATIGISGAELIAALKHWKHDATLANIPTVA